MRSRPLALAFTAVLSATLLLLPVRADAHTEADLVAVAAGDTATLTLKPTHGCEGSPTVEVAIQAPVAGATAVEVDGWTATSTDDAEAGTTVLEWTEGSLPADQDGAFPVEFTVPDQVGELLLFPSVQVCEDGQELSWIEGDPEAEYPAPRILVLPAGSEPATSIEDVPADAPGRDQLTAIVDVDNPDDEETTDEGASTTTEAGEAAETTTSSAGESDEDVANTPIVGDTETESEPQDQDDEIGLALIIAVVLVLAIGGGAAYAFSRRRKTA